ncbi:MULTISPECIES: LPP20 family lipoprotein [unclassified Oleiphilus]|uniref:LPP20 family lipoprotein n=1 Tax=unclassified Oleiphilus TaxID=2631174 RepID=UPI0007C253FF|nr:MULTISPECIES: LPP20 family lipoprotein [unclassified Oleiphilus]KZZ34788.1 hypothetical protein A3756_17160 [Oleiphilus sp. HI0086]KZZ38110.1 hypothetical protein A3757_08730 [Oleiphilus sp. HI0117]KZZ53647.1 hypothetical protein A3761_02330 [Oleiphilus sp. HI0123]
MQLNSGKISINRHQLTFIALLLSIAFPMASWADDSIPSWVKRPPADDSQFMYGVGEGDNLDSAKQSALKDIAGKLSTNVSSESENRDYLSNGVSESSFSQKVNTRIQDVKLSGFDVRESLKRANKHYVLLAMKRSTFVADKVNQLNEVNNSIDAELQGLSGKNKLLQLLAYNQANTYAIQGRELVSLIHAADPSQNKQGDLDRYRSFVQKEKALLEQTKFSLNSDASLKPLVRHIKKIMQTNGFQVTSPMRADSIIELEGSIKEKEIFSTKMVNIDLEILVKTDSEQLVSSNSYQLKGSSVSSFDSSRDKAMQQIANEVKSKIDVYRMLGLVN